MTDIRMSDDFKIPVNAESLFGTLEKSKAGSIEWILIRTNAVIAINAYDANQERIRQLISCGNEFECVIDMQRERIDQLESHAVDMGKMAEGCVDKISTLKHENALLENQLKNAQEEIAELKKKARGY